MRRTPAVLAAAGSAALAVGLLAGCAQPNVFANCAAMHAKYPHGVGRVGAVDHVSSGKPVTTFLRNATIYNANLARDADRDGIACEAH